MEGKAHVKKTPGRTKTCSCNGCLDTMPATHQHSKDLLIAQCKLLQYALGGSGWPSARHWSQHSTLHVYSVLEAPENRGSPRPLTTTSKTL